MFVAMALTDEWKSGAEIKKQASKDGATGRRDYGLELDPEQIALHHAKASSRIIGRSRVYGCQKG